MNIVILDGYCMNPGDLSWAPLEALGHLTVHDRTPEDKVLERAREAEILLTNKTVVPREVIEQLPRLKYIGLLATGYNVVDVKAAKQRGIPVTNVPTYGTASVAQMVFAHLLNLTQHVAHHGLGVREGRWCRSEDWCYWDRPLVELQGLTLGIVGFGRIGRAVAGRGLAFGMKVLACDPYLPPVLPEGVECANLDRTFRESDALTLHCPLTPKTEGLVNRDRLAAMKRTAYLINTSRGPLVDEHALAEALNAGVIAGAGLDVLSKEPPCEDNPLLSAKNCIITPHIAWASKAARERLLEAVVANVRAFLEGDPRNLVNP
jgi:glycerate dehydrogenase